MVKFQRFASTRTVTARSVPVIFVGSFWLVVLLLLWLLNPSECQCPLHVSRLEVFVEPFRLAESGREVDDGPVCVFKPIFQIVDLRFVEP